MKFLRIPVDQYSDVVQLLQLEHYGEVVGLLDYRGRTQAVAYVLQNMVENVSWNELLEDFQNSFVNYVNMFYI